MDYVFKIYDAYNLRVRISVGIIVLAPLVLSLYLLVPGTRSISFTAIIIAVSFGMCNLMISLSRYHGRESLRKCFPELLPAQQMLLPEDNSIDAITKERYHKFLSSKINNLSFSRDNNHVESSCNSAVNWLISQTRDAQKFPLIKEESINFGFAKNLYGLKKIGIIISSILLVVETTALFVKIMYSLDFLEFSCITTSIVISLSYLLMWIFIINKKWVIDSGKKYAKALLSSCDSEFFCL